MAYPGSGRQHQSHQTVGSGYAPPPTFETRPQFNQYGPPPGPPPQQQYNQYQPPPQQQYNQYQPPQQPPPPQQQQQQFAPPSQQQQHQQFAPPPGFSSYPPPATPPPQSQTRGARKAVCIGINYTGTSNDLAGCHNDARNMAAWLTASQNYRAENIVLLLDAPGIGLYDPSYPSRRNMTDAMRWLVRDAQPGDTLFISYSGHGGLSPNTDGTEESGFDDTILPADFKTAGEMIDDEVHDILCRPLMRGVRLTAIFDSCHSGSVCDLPFVYSTEGLLKSPNVLKEAGQGAMGAVTSYMRGDMGGVFSSLTSFGKQAMNGNRIQQQNQATRRSDADIISWSGCKDDQTSADASEGGKATGALSYAFLLSLSRNPRQSYNQLLNSIRDELRGKYSQRPQLSSSHELDCNLLAIM